MRYELPLSKVVQSLKKNSTIETSWDTTKKFLLNCTTANINIPERASLTINNNKERDTKQFEINATKLFGGPNNHFDGLYNQFKWELKSEELNQAIQLMIDSQPYSLGIRPYMSLRIDYFFVFVHPETTEVLPNQDTDSHLAIFLEKNSNVMPEFWFPFVEVNELQNYLEIIEPYLPFKKLDKKAFRLIEPNKQKTKNLIRKIILQ